MPPRTQLRDDATTAVTSYKRGSKCVRSGAFLAGRGRRVLSEHETVTRAVSLSLEIRVLSLNVNALYFSLSLVPLRIPSVALWLSLPPDIISLTPSLN